MTQMKNGDKSKYSLNLPTVNCLANSLWHGLVAHAHIQDGPKKVSHYHNHH